MRGKSAAIVAGALAGLVIIACTDGAQKSITAPTGALSGPRNSTIFDGGFSNPGKVDVCVDGAAPPGTYKFKNAGFLSDFEIGVSDATLDGADGGDGTTVPNVSPDGTEYIVAVGGCVSVETRTSPDHGYPGSAECPIFLDVWKPDFFYSIVPLRGIRDPAGHGQWVQTEGTSGPVIPTFNDAGGTTVDGTVVWQDQGPYPSTRGPIGGHWCTGFPDTWSGITVELSTIPVTAVYSKTDCILDQGVKPAIPNSGSGTIPPFQCGSGNQHTRAYANHDHGSVLDYFFDTAPPPTPGCVATFGWFKNQGNSVVPTTSFFGTAASWRDVLATKPMGNDYYNLAFQYIAAKLGIGGATPPHIVGHAITVAESFFTGRALGSTDGWAGPPLSSIADILDKFNNGYGTDWPHCTLNN